MSENLTWSNHIETKKIRTHHAKIVVECTTGKPYYSIEWFDTAKQEYYLGYSSYCIDNVLGWLKEFFEIVEAPKTNADCIRARSDEELVELLYNGINDEYCRNDPMCGAMLDTMQEIPEEKCKKCLLEWLKQPADGGESG